MRQQAASRPGGALVAAWIAVAATSAGTVAGANPTQPLPTVSLTSSDATLETGFAWARDTALGYVFEGDPVGPWFEAALPGRAAFCMRDVAHQTHGALALGLDEHLRNMLGKFAVSVSASRRWAGYWEIDRLDRPAPVDYRSDADFWYNLPANFDVVDAIARAYDWTGDRRYLDDAAFVEFARRSLIDYVTAWDLDGDGLMESAATNGHRGIPTYWEGGGPRALTGADLVGAQYAGNAAYARLLRLRGELEETARFESVASTLRARFNERWWNEDGGRFYTAILADGVFDGSNLPLGQIYPLYFDIIEPGERRQAVVERLPDGGAVELNSYMAEVLYASGEDERAYQYLLGQMDPALARREYPENPFTAVGTTVHGLMGIRPLAAERLLETRPALPVALDWVALTDLPVLGRRVGIRHDGNTRSRLYNGGSERLRWRAVLPGDHSWMAVDGRPVPARNRTTAWGSIESFVDLDVAAGASATVTAATAQNFTLAGIEVALAGDPGTFAISVQKRTLEPGVEIAEVALTSPSPAAPPQLTLRWSLPSIDVHGVWSAAARFEKSLGPNWGPSAVRSMLARNAPVLTLFGADDGNRMTFAVSEALGAVDLSAGIREEDARVLGQVDLFVEPHRPVTEASFELRFDRRGIPYFEALADVSAWWAARPEMTPAPVPDAARQPMYSTWYSYHQSITAAALLEEVEVASSLGYEAIIVDDGWQTLDSRRGYAYTGDWKPERIPEMKGFVDAVHGKGMKVLLWYSLPLVGENSRAFPRFAGKYLRYWDGQGAFVLDPRYPDVRAHIIGTYRTAMREWGVDGLKLDFLGFLTADADTELTLADGRDYASVNEAADRLMTDIMAQLRTERPDVMIEFRQPYIGPLMRKYGNMFRAGDAPDAVVDNRVRTIDLRLLSGDTAVHSDMFMWHYDEPVEVAALQFLNILFAVPQISVRLREIPPDHLEMVRFWTAWWRENRGVLLEGTLEPTAPLANYPLVTAHDDVKRIVALYQDVVVRLDAGSERERIDVVNAKASAGIVLRADADFGTYRYTVTDALGRQVADGELRLTPGAHALDVPPAGLLALVRSAGWTPR